jgi:hypothetical protein
MLRRHARWDCGAMPTSSPSRSPAMAARERGPRAPHRMRGGVQRAGLPARRRRARRSPRRLLGRRQQQLLRPQRQGRLARPRPPPLRLRARAPALLHRLREPRHHRAARAAGRDYRPPRPRARPRYRPIRPRDGRAPARRPDHRCRLPVHADRPSPHAEPPRDRRRIGRPGDPRRHLALPHRRCRHRRRARQPRRLPPAKHAAARRPGIRDAVRRAAARPKERDPYPQPGVDRVRHQSGDHHAGPRQRIDTAEPHSRVSAASRRGARRLRVSWRHRDRGSGVGRIAVFASEGAKPFRRVRVAARARHGALPRSAADTTSSTPWPRTAQATPRRHRP